jgi:hypothetical protein
MGNLTREDAIGDFEKYSKELKRYSSEIQDRVEFGLYGGIYQYFINGVDGSIAQLGLSLPSEPVLKKIIIARDKEHKILLKNH